MLMTALKGELAVKQSIDLVKTFKKRRFGRIQKD